MIALRAAGPTDAGAVGAILSEFVDTTPWMPRIHSRAEDVAHAAKMIDFGWVTLAQKGSETVGFLARNVNELNALYVAQSARNAGVGSALISAAQEATDRLELWTFQANTAALRFYARHGLTEVSRTDGAGRDEKLPDVQLEWHRKDI